MKFIINIIRAILVVILLLCIIAFGMIRIASSTILSESYILKQLEEANYYANIYTQVKSDFENYIYQSGLDEKVIENIISIEDIKSDTQLIISNIYSGNNKKIDVSKLKENLNNNINESLQNQKISATTQKSINEFVEKIANQYIESMLHTNFEEKINDIYQKVKEYIDIGAKVILVTIGISTIAILAIQYKKIFRNFALIGISLTGSGFFYIFVNMFINSKIKIANIVILNDAISITLRSIITNILDRINNCGLIFCGVGIILIFIGNFLTKDIAKKRYLTIY